MKFYFVILLYGPLESFHAANAKKDLSSEFTNSAALDEAQKVTLYWSVDWKARSISFAVGTNYWMGWLWDFKRPRANDRSGHRNWGIYR